MIPTLFNVLSFEVENWPIPPFQPALAIDVVQLADRDVTVGNCHEHPEDMQKEEYEEWMSIDEDFPVAAALTDLEICRAVCEQNQAIKVDDSDWGECVIENPPTNAEIKQALDISKRGVQNNKRRASFNKF
ncbi:hypothetical protein AVEN_111664-1 [Araneus ventricosus]|uniref:Uncharacterized protein n=2 Tax=Araneus ventricosus TaxID=182803 RepID=A0A4Y2KI84_ARAVE|nr:hypothetical protein AVEN_239277-1 [Araneus ventricosus]GBN02338.1 hypothetical protein AVEN_83794-1 [Araneus ventricosus]GBN02364.1 hypothetical protein AVEN_111664-1 [Araneus ventricosus]